MAMSVTQAQTQAQEGGQQGAGCGVECLKKVIPGQILYNEGQIISVCLNYRRTQERLSNLRPIVSL